MNQTATIEAASARPAVRDAYRLTLKRFNEGLRVDMGGLAEELGVTRMTLYRWVGSREQLLVDILWVLTEDAFRILGEDVDESIPDPHAAVLLSGFVQMVADHPGMKRFLAEEPDLALRLLTTRAAGFQARLIGLVDRLLLDDIANSRLRTSVGHEDLAFVAVRIVESFVYTRSLGTVGEGPDPQRARTAIHAVIHNCGDA